ncbi:thioredoxin domain-containing protein 11 [Clonorchis sinensis]|uniref:Thioredoxin domain-containing protein 11 n=1 Tax=Clonorchis sinensis TaxID=79923 RepID=G7YVR9_CLOSI|nr:thioredoxin domain-containing protein 11 [Clonorchis sinensis]
MLVCNLSSQAPTDTNDAQPFFKGSMASVDNFRGSFDELGTSLKANAISGVFFYAKWDLEAIEARATTTAYDYRMKQLEADALVENIVHKIHSLPTECLHSTDLTPINRRRSTYLDTVFSSGPTLILVGPHLSTVRGMDPSIYLLRSLELSYKSCPSGTNITALLNTHQNVNSTTRQEAQKLMHQLALSAYHERRKQASVCPRWLRYLGPLLGLKPRHVCGVSNHVSMLGNGEDTADSTNSELPILSKLLKMLHSRPTSDMLETIITLLHELSLESDSPLPIPHTGIDASAMLERLHFLCCSWYHRDHRPDEDCVSSSSNCIPVGTPTLPPVLSSVNGLACGRNKTLSFHTLDSLEQPGLVWSLTGFRVQTASSESGAAIVDKAAEVVYRLEEPVSYESLSRFISDYHSSKLLPWRRHPLPSDQVHQLRPTESLGRRILEIRNASHLEHLLDSRSYIRSGASRQTALKTQSGLLLLYYTRTCAYASHGDSLLWHFTRVAESFPDNNTVLFAKVDISEVDLPWHLRVERVPTVIFFPANRSTYSIRFYWPITRITDPSMELVKFVRKQLGKPPFFEHISPILLESAEARTWLWKALHGSDSILLAPLHGYCTARSTSVRNFTCLKGVLASITIYIRKYVHSLSVYSAVVGHLEGNLQRINDRLTCPFTRLYGSTRSPRNLHRSLDALLKQSRLWNNAMAHIRNLSNTLQQLVSQAKSIKLLL